MMKYSEIRGNLFDYSSTHYLVHCISSDFEMGKGIVVQFNKRFDLKNEIWKKYNGNLLSQWPDNCSSCDLISFSGRKGVFSLITKKRYFQKPTYDTLRRSLEDMKLLLIELVQKNNENGSSEKIKIALPAIGCGLDKLDWKRVKGILFDIFNDMDIEMLFVSQ